MKRRVQLTVLLAIAALIANSRCYARCLTSSQSHSGCHHSSSSNRSGSQPCNYQHHSEAAAPELKVDVAKVPALPSLPLAFVSTASDMNFGPRYAFTKDLAERASPPPSPLFLTISVLRL